MPKASSPDCISVVDLKNCKSEGFKTLAKLSQICLKESRLLEDLICGTCGTLDSNLNHRFVKHHKKCSLFSDFHFGFRYSRSNLDLLTVVSDRTAPVSDRSVT